MHQTETKVDGPEPSGLILVNAITSSRLILAGIYAWYIFLPGRQLSVVTLLFAAICATDLMDGVLARRFSASSRLGSVFDVSADLFFILCTYPVLIMQDVLPAWMLAAAILKFAEFCITSAWFSKRSGKGMRALRYDPIGKAAGITFFILPYPAVLLYDLLPHPIAVMIIDTIGCAVVLAASVSSVHRIRSCIDFYSEK